MIMSRKWESEMSSNVIHLPRPVSRRPSVESLGFFVRVGRNDHVEMLHLVASGERGMFGFVIEAHNIERHRELISEARRHDFDVILDPKTQQMGFVGGHSESLAALPWGLERHHNVADFEGGEERRRAAQIIEVAGANGFTQVLGPTHLLNGPNDPWLRRDIAMMNWTADEIAQRGASLGLVYSLALPMALLRQPAERHAIISAVADAACDAIWLKVENFGDDATGEKTAAYIEACRDFHERGLPVVGDHVGGLPGLGVLAFGAVGGIAHGVTTQQNFKVAHWRRPPVAQSGGVSRRVYFPQLDVLLKPKVAEVLLGTSRWIKGKCGCLDTHCCPHGLRDMIGNPARHAIYQRAREIERLSKVPQSMRARQYLNENLRPVSDIVARVAATSGMDDDLQKRLRTKQREMARLRETMAHLVEGVDTAVSVALSPPRREGQDGS
jgi:hypothetical protein